MSESVELLYNRDEEMEDNYDDVWDDSLLIRAYNNAVELAKESITKKMAGENRSSALAEKTATLNSYSDAGQQQPKKKFNLQEDKEVLKNEESFDEQNNKGKKKSKKVSPQSMFKWREGMPCRAVFSEDGREYEATIKSIHGDMCDVVYVGYNNKESVDLYSLKPSHGEGARSAQELESGSANLDSMNGVHHSGTKYSYPHAHSDDVSIIPPPPPPNVMAHFPRDESDALSAMLMSWYMSGYHTGYYQGLTRSKKCQGPSM